MDTAAVKKGRGGEEGSQRRGERKGTWKGGEGKNKAGPVQLDWSTGERAGGRRSHRCSTETQQ